MLMITLLNKFDDNYVIKKEDVLEISSKYAKDNNLSSCISDVVFTEDGDSIYDPNSKLIRFNIDRIVDVNRELFERLKQEFQIDDKYTSYYLNYYYLNSIYNILCHVKQKAQYEDKDNILGYLYDLSERLDVDRESKLLIPMEREANNTGLLTAYTLMNYTKLPSKEAHIMQLQYLNNLLLNYRRRNNYQVSSPIDALSDMFPNIDIDRINELLDQSKLSRIDRINLGLPISPKEFDTVNSEVTKRLIKTNHNS